MQRQAVPLLIAEPPLVTTGIEDAVARDSGACITARGPDGDIIRGRPHRGPSDSAKGGGGAIDLYQLKKYRRSNQDTCINQAPAVQTGDHVKVGGVLADGPGTAAGQLALDATSWWFMPWEGYNFEEPSSSPSGWSRRYLHVHPHHRVRVEAPRHEARRGGDHPRHPNVGRGPGSPR